MKFTLCGRLMLAALAMLLGFAQPVGAQQRLLAELQSRLVGTWLTTVEGEARARYLVIEGVTENADKTYSMTGRFYFTDIKPVAFKNGEVRQEADKVEIVFRTGADSLYTATLNADGTFAGTTKYTNGQVKPIKIAKAAPAAPAVTVTEFDGRWSGDSYSNVGRQCGRGIYDIVVKDGKASGTARFEAGVGAAVSTVTGEVGPDKTMSLRVVKQQQVGRTTRFQGMFDKNEFTALDPVGQGGQCGYDVKLKRSS